MPTDPLQQRENRLLAVCENSNAVEEGIRKAAMVFGLSEDNPSQRAWLWLHLAELKDYIAPGRKKS